MKLNKQDPVVVPVLPIVPILPENPVEPIMIQNNRILKKKNYYFHHLHHLPLPLDPS